MTQDQITELKTMGVPGVIKKYLPRIGKTPEEGGITRDQYEALLKLVAPLSPREAPNLASSPISSDAHPRDPGTSGRQDQEAPRQDGPDTQDVSPEDFIRAFTTHTDQKAGTSQKARLLALLQDGGWHDTPEIMAKIYKVGDERGNCRIPSRICELRQEGHNIETKRITQTLTAYRLTN